MKAMKRKVLHTVLSIFALVLLASRSCESDPVFNPESGQQAEEEYDLRSMKSEFETPYLTDEKLVVFNETGRQKMQDLSEYLSLYASRDTDSSFKAQIKDMIFRLFYDSSAVVQLALTQSKTRNDLNENLAGILQELDSSPYQSVMITPSNLKIMEPLHLEKEGRYAGTLDCSIRISGIAENDTTLLYQGLKQIDIVAIRTEKQFGNANRVKVWQVFLDRIHEQGETI